LIEFTGERVVPGQVDTDLWNEHIARYHFAKRLARSRRVLDLACGTGYGAAVLAEGATRVTGVDISAGAISYAREHYDAGNLNFLEGNATRLTELPDGTFDLITAFELIEHLEDWRALLSEARRLLAYSGQFIVSTPNRLYYAESRHKAGPNPFHVHEFTFTEFQAALAEYFPHAALFVQNHAAGVVFQPLKPSVGADFKLEHSGALDADSAHFFIAVCAATPQVGGSAFIYLPTAANVLREREHHIARLEGEVAQKTEWLQQSQREHQELVQLHTAQKDKLEAANHWAGKLNGELEESSKRIVQLQNQLAETQLAAHESAAGYEEKITQLHADLADRTAWAHETEQRLNSELDASRQELAKCVSLLDTAEKTVEERTLWAQRLEAEKKMIQSSRWVRLGRSLGLGPAA
jgi:ubiquinone/menaquinone biosynthesis C-methylase UbiE